MKYYIQRGLNEYGPYTLADLQRYIASGNIQLSDLTRNESMTEWVPVSQVIGNIPLPAPAAPAGAPYGSTPAEGAGTVYGGANPAATTAAASGPSSPGSIPTYGNPAGSYTGASIPAGGTVYGGPGAPGGPAYPGALPAYGTGAMRGALIPPDFHWGLVLLIGIFTCGIFFSVWLIVEAVFVRKIKPQSNALMFAIIGIVLSYGGGFVSGFIRAMNHGVYNPIGGLSTLAAWVLILVAVFQMKSELEDYYNSAEPINLRLSGVMVFFFAVFYFQHHFSRIASWKKSGYLVPQ